MLLCGLSKKKKTTLNVKIRDGRLHALYALEMTLFNVQGYVDNEKSGGDSIFYGDVWSLPVSPVSSSRAFLRNMEHFQNQSLPKYFSERRETLAKFLLEFWIKLGKTVMRLFGAASTLTTHLPHRHGEEERISTENN